MVTSLPADPLPVLEAAATRLAAEGTAALPDVLARVVSALGLRSAVLRSAPGQVLAVAGEVLHAVPHPRSAGAGAVIELPVHAGGRRVATLTVVGARRGMLPLLRALCGVLGLTVAPRGAALPLALLQAADADADAAVDALHDGPVQELVLARFAADAAARSSTDEAGEPARAREAVQAALQSLRRTLWLLRPRGAGDGGLHPALEQLSQHLVEAGRPGLELDVDPDAAALLAPAASAVAYRLVQAAARNADRPLAVRVARSGSTVRVDVHAGAPLADHDAWLARAQALGAELTTELDGRTSLALPVAAHLLSSDLEALP